MPDRGKSLKQRAREVEEILRKENSYLVRKKKEKNPEAKDSE